MNYTVMKQNVSNVTEKNNIKSVIKRKKTERKYRSSSIKNINNPEKLKSLTKDTDKRNNKLFIPCDPD